MVCGYVANTNISRRDLGDITTSMILKATHGPLTWEVETLSQLGALVCNGIVTSPGPAASIGGTLCDSCQSSVLCT